MRWNEHRLAACLMAESNRVRICVPVCVSIARELESAIARAAKAGDIIELRLDCLEPFEFEKALEEVEDFVRESARPTIMTLRPAEQGGRRELDYASRYVFWCSRNYPPHANLIDVELDLATGFASSDNPPPLPVKWERIICSHHDFAGVPANLEQIYERMASTPARILKIAVQAGDVTDCIPVFKLLERARREGREMIAIAMGTAGIATRILGPSHGAFLTYGALETDSATAPGQLSAKELRELYHIHGINEQTRIMGLVGLPVGHSVSPHVHNAAFAAAGVNAVYIPFEVRDLKSFFRRLIHPRTRELDWNLHGLSVTAPHKATVMDYLDWVEPAAKEIGAVNTVVVVGDALHGYNTDATSVLQPVLEKLGPLRDACCAIVGAGGAASAALWSLRREGARATVFARNVEKGKSLAEKFAARCENLEAARFDGFDLVINATPLGTRGQRENETPAISNQLRGARFAYDLVYNPIQTRFLREAREAGCETLGGLSMLVQQATEQFKLWTGADAPIEVMRDAAGRALH
jgi:3-dehydroquinate dehydratase / shikimate dehydrogenase